MSAGEDTPASRNTNRAPRPHRITTFDPVFVITGVDDLAVRGDIASASGTSYFPARATLSTHLALHPRTPAICRSFLCMRWP